MGLPPVTFLAPDPRLDGWPKPIGFGNDDDVPNWLHYTLYKPVAWRDGVMARRLIGLNCFHNKALPRHQ